MVIFRLKRVSDPWVIQVLLSKSDQFRRHCQVKDRRAVLSRKAAQSLYQYSLATYDRGDQFDHAAAQGFISIYGLPVRTQSRAQGE